MVEINEELEDIAKKYEAYQELHEKQLAILIGDALNILDLREFYEWCGKRLNIPYKEARYYKDMYNDMFNKVGNEE